jgi:sodium/potassium-transporting ATPase subunit beta
MLMAFFSTLPTDSPKWTLDASIIGSNPGLGLRPKQIDARIDSSLILVSPKAPADQKPSKDFETQSNADWAERTRVYLSHFDNKTDLIDGCPGGKRSPTQKEGCTFDVSVLGNCKDFPYGYLPTAKTGNQVAPCVFFKPNRLFNWEPMTYENQEEVDDDSYLTPEAKRLIKQGLNKLYIDCQGENMYDKEGLNSQTMTYYPSDQGIDMKYFPYSGGNYHNPTVAVQFSNLEKGRLYHVECKLWGKGIRHDSKDRMGLVHFEIMFHEALSSDSDA